MKACRSYYANCICACFFSVFDPLGSECQKEDEAKYGYELRIVGHYRGVVDVAFEAVSNI